MCTDNVGMDVDMDLNMNTASSIDMDMYVKKYHSILFQLFASCRRDLC
jgi:hypothetical protein